MGFSEMLRNLKKLNSYYYTLKWRKYSSYFQSSKRFYDVPKHLWAIPPVFIIPNYMCCSVDLNFFFFLFRATPVAYGSSLAGGESEMQLPSYSTATAMPDLSHIHNLHCNLQQCWIFNPLSKGKDQTCILMDISQVLSPLSHNKNSILSSILMGEILWKENVVRAHWFHLSSKELLLTSRHYLLYRLGKSGVLLIYWGRERRERPSFWGAGKWGCAPQYLARALSLPNCRNVSRRKVEIEKRWGLIQSRNYSEEVHCICMFPP